MIPKNTVEPPLSRSTAALNTPRSVPGRSRANNTSAPGETLHVFRSERWRELQEPAELTRNGREPARTRNDPHDAHRDRRPVRKGHEVDTRVGFAVPTRRVIDAKYGTSSRLNVARRLNRSVTASPTSRCKRSRRRSPKPRRSHASGPPPAPAEPSNGRSWSRSDGQTTRPRHVVRSQTRPSRVRPTNGRTVPRAAYPISGSAATASRSTCLVTKSLLSSTLTSLGTCVAGNRS